MRSSRVCACGHSVCVHAVIQCVCMRSFSVCACGHSVCVHASFSVCACGHSVCVHASFSVCACGHSVCVHALIVGLKDAEILEPLYYFRNRITHGGRYLAKAAVCMECMHGVCACLNLIPYACSACESQRLVCQKPWVSIYLRSFRRVDQHRHHL